MEDLKYMALQMGALLLAVAFVVFFERNCR